MSVRATKKVCLSAVEELSKQNELSEIPHFTEEIEHFRHRLQDDEFRIAVVGEFSSGKSTFINALLGKDLLQHATTETTATLTRLVNVAASDPRCGKGTVRLRSGESICLNEMNNLREYTTTASERFNVVDDIKSVELYLPVMESSHNIVIIDTPGLNGTADGHREQTVRFIQQAHACIYLLQRRGLAESDVEFLTYLSQIQKNFIFVQNFIDDLHTSEGDSLEEKLAAQTQILDEKVFVNAPHARYSICGVSALLALAGRDDSMTTLYADSDEILTPERRKDLYARSHLDDFYKLMARTFPDDRLEAIQYGDTAAALVDWMRMLSEQIVRRETQAQELYQASSDHHSIEKLERLREKTIESRERHKKQLENFILDKGRSLRASEKDIIHEELQQIAQDIRAEISKFEALLQLEEWSKNLPDILSQKINQLLIRHDTRYDQQVQAFYQLLLTRIEEYSSIRSEELDLKPLQSGKVSQTHDGFKQELKEIEKIREQTAKKKGEIERIERELASIEAAVGEQQSEIQDLERSISNCQSQISRRKARLGSRPQAVEREESYTVEEPRGGILGFLWGLVVGPKKVKKYRTVTDDSEGQEWDKQMASQVNPLTREKSRLQKQLEAAKRSELRLRDESQDREDAYRRAKRRVEELEAKARAEEETLRYKQEYAAKEYLAECKRNLSAQVENYLLGEHSVEVQIMQNVSDKIELTEKDFIIWAFDRFQKAIDKKLEWIRQVKLQKYPELLKQVHSLTATKEIIAKLMKNVEAQII